MTDNGVFCYHEAIRGCADEQEYYSKIINNAEYPILGDSSSSAPLMSIQVLFPKAPIVIIERDPEDVLKSLDNFFGRVTSQLPMLNMLKTKIDSLVGLRVKFDEIDDRLEEIWNYCLGGYIPFDSKRADMLKNFNVSIKMPEYEEKDLTLIKRLLSCHG